MKGIQKLKDLIKDNDSKEILTKTFFFLIIRFLGLLAGYFFIFIIAKYYGAAVNGLISISFSFFLLSSILGRLGIDINLVKFYSIDKNEKEKGLFYRVLIKSIIASSIVALLLYYFRDFFVYTLFKKPELKPYLLWTLLTVPFWSIILICAGFLRAKKLNNWHAFLNNPGRFIFSIIILFIIQKEQPLNVIKAHFYGVFLLAFVSVIITSKKLKKISFKSTHNSWQFIKESFPMMLSSTILIFLGWSDTFVLGIYENSNNVGVYNVALKIATITSFSLQAVNSILAPIISKMYNEGKKDNLEKVILFSTRLNFYITAFIILIIIIFHKLILGVFGEEFVLGSIVLIILCVGQLVNSISGSVGIILHMTGHQLTFQNIVLTALILNLILNFTLTPTYGTIGAAIATVISISSWNIYGAIFLKRKLKIKSFYIPFI
ncbi:flippase [Leptobacterium sp. I13]|uniref:flippase n=1 Tax=Leptobacterium meishanense TaxID=3128904 RepID=UPI0030EC8764